MTSTARYQSDPRARHNHNARQAVTNAVRRGRMRKRPCCVCESCDSEAHHPDHGYPFRVAWMCRRHHRQLHDAPTERLERAVERALREQLPEALAVEWSIARWALGRTGATAVSAVQALADFLGGAIEEVDLPEIEVEGVDHV